MLQIRLSNRPSGEGGPGPARSTPSAETVTVACPDHLVIADLPVAKSLGAVTSSAAPAIRSLGRRSRRLHGERVHFCVRCDFPIAIYGRLSPCDHIFCLTCARSDSSCYLCDERIQKIHIIKMMEGIFICAAPQCLKSFLTSSEHQSHIRNTHLDLLQTNVEKGGNEVDASNIGKPSSSDLHKQSSQQQEASTARAPSRQAFSPNSNSQLQDRDEKSRQYQPRDQPLQKPPLQPKLPPFQGRPPNQPIDPQLDNHPTQSFEKPHNWLNQQQNFENLSNFHQPPTDKQTGVPTESPFPSYPPMQPLQPPNYQLPINANQGPAATPSFNYPFPAEGLQPYYSAPFEMPRPESMPQNVWDQSSVMGFPPAQPAGVASVPDSYPRPWGMQFVTLPFNPLTMGQALPEGFAKSTDPQGASADQNDGKGVLASVPLQLPLAMSLPPPPPLPPPLPQQLNRGNFSAPGNTNPNQDVQGF